VSHDLVFVLPIDKKLLALIQALQPNELRYLTPIATPLLPSTDPVADAIVLLHAYLRRNAMISALWQAFAVQLHNHFFSGGLALGITGAFVAAIASVPHILRRLMTRWGIVVVHLDNRSELFEQVLAWLNEHSYAKNCRRLSAKLVIDPNERKRIQFTPGPGWHWFWHKGRLLWLDREEQKGQGTIRTLGSDSDRRESLTIRILGQRSEPLRHLLTDIQRQYDGKYKDRIRIHAADAYNGWNLIARVKKRPLHSVILAAGQVEDITADIRQFRAKEAWYAERGIPWRRGYLLYGPPGTGKTSLVRAVASEFSFDLAMLNIASNQLDDIMLTTLMADAPRHSILLLEDVDAAFINRNNGSAGKGITFSGLLNAIDGVMSQEGHILFMTTNHPDRLDQALIRPGRIDRRYELGTVTAEQAARHYKLYFPESSPGECERFVSDVTDQQLTPAAIQEMLLGYVASSREEGTGTKSMTIASVTGTRQ
jgi:mitochondrial chaperone BCS1